MLYIGSVFGNAIQEALDIALGLCAAKQLETGIRFIHIVCDRAVVRYMCLLFCVSRDARRDREIDARNANGQIIYTRTHIYIWRTGLHVLYTYRCVYVYHLLP